MTDANVTVRGITSGTRVASSTSVNSVSASVGDYIAAFASTNYQGSLTFSTSPSGVDTWNTIPAGNTSDTLRTAAVFAKVTTSGVKSVTANTPGSASNIDVIVMVLDPETGTITLDGTTSTNDTSSPFTHSSLSPAGTKDFLICFHGQVQFSGTSNYGNAPSGMTIAEEVYQNPNVGFQVCYQQLTASGSTGTRSQTSSPTSVNGGAGGMVALRNDVVPSGPIEKFASDSFNVTETQPTSTNQSSHTDIITLTDSVINIFVTLPPKSDSFPFSEIQALNTSSARIDSATLSELTESHRSTISSDDITFNDIAALTVLHNRVDALSFNEQPPAIATSTSDQLGTLDEVTDTFRGYLVDTSDLIATLTEASETNTSQERIDVSELEELTQTTTSRPTVDSATLTETAYITIITQDLATLDEFISGRTIDVFDNSLVFADTQFSYAWLTTSDSALFTDQRRESEGPSDDRTVNLYDLVTYEPPRRGQPFRLIAQDVFTKQFLHWDLPVEDVSIKKTISGPCIISGVISTEIKSLFDLDPPLEPDRTRIHVEEDGQILASGILMPYTDNNESKTRTIEAEGNSSYPHWIYYQGQAYQGVQVDPADMFRLLWDHVQSYPEGDIGVQVSNTQTPVRIGTEPKNVEFETDEGEQVSFVAGPYALNFWSVKNCGTEIETLCKETPMEFSERSVWNADRTDVLHYIDIGYPRVGRRRDDLGFREGENFYNLIPDYSENKDNYASEVIVVGAGDGPDAIRQITSGRFSPRRLRKTVVIQNEDILTEERALAISQFEFRKRRLSRYQIKSITIDTTHPNALFGAFQEGDDILVEGTVQYIGKIADLHRIVSYVYYPRHKTATLDLQPSESFDYGALKVD